MVSMGFILKFALQCTLIYGRNVWFKKVILGDVMTSYYSQMKVDISLAACGMKCAKIPGCKALFYMTKTCYHITKRVDHRIGSVNLTSIYLDTRLEGECTSLGYTPFIEGLFCTKFINNSLNWTDAKTGCEEEGATLLMLKMDDFEVKRKALVIYHEMIFYLGASDLDVEGEWVWVDGTPMSRNHTNWQPNQPDNHNSNEHVLEIVDGFLFNDIPPHVMKISVCEILL